jgi:hypothetical protein
MTTATDRSERQSQLARMIERACEELLRPSLGILCTCVVPDPSGERDLIRRLVKCWACGGWIDELVIMRYSDRS